MYSLYCIRNIHTTKTFIGKSTIPQYTLDRAVKRLNSGVFKNRDLLADWKKFGAQSFEFSVCQSDIPDHLVDTIKQSLIDIYHKMGLSYNICGTRNPRRGIPPVPRTKKPKPPEKTPEVKKQEQIERGRNMGLLNKGRTSKQKSKFNK